MSVIDQARNVREGETLDEQRVDAYLKSSVPDLRGDIRIRQFPGGASNLTYLIEYDNRAMVLRRPPFGKIAKSAHDMSREATVLMLLAPVYPYVPKVLAKCQDDSVMGCDFFVMERLEGVIPRKDFPQDLQLSVEQVRKLCLNGIDKLLELHAVDAHDPSLRVLGKGGGYVARQIHGWCDRFVKAKTPDVASFAVVMQWLDEHMPEDCGLCVIHNDFRFDNLVFDPQHPTNIIGVLDWEMATLGDPLMDLGNSLAYWIEANDPEPMHQARMQPTHREGMLSRQEVIDYYLEQSGRQVESFIFYEVYGVFRLAVIAQQIYYRFYHKQTQDKRFASFGLFVGLLEQRCQQLIAEQG